MFFIFGWGRTTKKKVETVVKHCDICGQEANYNALIVRRWFTLFFIPVIPYDKEYWWICENCQRGYKLNSEPEFLSIVNEIQKFKSGNSLEEPEGLNIKETDKEDTVEIKDKETATVNSTVTTEQKEYNIAKDTLIKFAGFWTRFLAYFIDNVIVNFASFIILVILLMIVPSIEDLAGGSIILLVYFVLNWLYFSLMEMSPAQGTVGKIIFKIVVTDLDGKPISFLRASGRFFGKILSSLFLLIGFLLAAFTDKKQGLHDILAGTLVIKKDSIVKNQDNIAKSQVSVN